MWEDIGDRTPEELDAADPVYRRWARARLRSGRLAAWIAESGGVPVASGCVWVMRVQPRPGWPSGETPYRLSMFTDPAHRGEGLAERIVREAISWSRQNGYARLVLHASEMGRPIYERLGFTRTWEMKLDLTDA